MPKRGRSILTTLFFTDIVGSTHVLEEMGDRRWRELLARHHRLIRDELKRYGGHELDTAGDGFFARFDTPASAISCACAVIDGVRDLGVELRVGIHIGECEILDGKVTGVNVHAAARTMAEATAGEVLVTSSVRDLVKGAGFDFVDRGMHELKGVEGDWLLFEVAAVDHEPRPAVLPDEEARARRNRIEPPPLVKRRGVRLTALLAVLTMVVAGVAVFVVRKLGESSASAITGCEVTIDSPLNDHGFNQAVFDGLTDAASTWGISVRDKVSKPGFPEVWTQHIGEFIDEECSLIVTYHPQMAAVALPIARANPTERFLVTDVSEEVSAPPNVLNVVFRSDQAAFVAGYLAAGMTKSGRVATFGGIPIDGVTQYMNGFAAGILYYNQANNTDVQLLGWNPDSLSGAFISDDPTDFLAFDDFRGARQMTADLIAQGADIVMPVDGTVGNQAAGAAAQRAEGVLLIGVDQDQHFAAPAYEALWLTSVLKGYRVMVYDAMGKIVHDEFDGGVLVGTLANDGVGLAPFYQFERSIPLVLQNKLRQVETRIVNGSLSVSPSSYL